MRVCMIASLIAKINITFNKKCLTYLHGVELCWRFCVRNNDVLEFITRERWIIQKTRLKTIFNFKLVLFISNTMSF